MWTLVKVSIIHNGSYCWGILQCILNPRDCAPFGHHQESWPLARSSGRNSHGLWRREWLQWHSPATKSYTLYTRENILNYLHWQIRIMNKHIVTCAGKNNFHSESNSQRFNSLPHSVQLNCTCQVYYCTHTTTQRESLIYPVLWVHYAFITHHNRLSICASITFKYNRSTF